MKNRNRNTSRGSRGLSWIVASDNDMEETSYPSSTPLEVGSNNINERATAILTSSHTASSNTPQILYSVSEVIYPDLQLPSVTQESLVLTLSDNGNVSSNDNKNTMC